MSLVFSDYIRVFRRVFIQRKYKRQKLENSKQFKAVFEEFLGFFLTFRKIFGKLRKFSENFGRVSFYKFSENLRNCLEIIGNFAEVIGTVRERS